MVVDVGVTLWGRRSFFGGAFPTPGWMACQGAPSLQPLSPVNKPTDQPQASLPKMAPTAGQEINLAYPLSTGGICCVFLKTNHPVVSALQHAFLPVFPGRCTRLTILADHETPSVVMAAHDTWIGLQVQPAQGREQTSASPPWSLK